MRPVRRSGNLYTREIRITRDRSIPRSLRFLI